MARLIGFCLHFAFWSVAALRLVSGVRLVQGLWSSLGAVRVVVVQARRGSVDDLVVRMVRKAKGVLLLVKKKNGAECRCYS